MLTKKEAIQLLTTNKSLANWMRAYIDQTGNYWIAGNGGQGSVIFKQLGSEHELNMIVNELFENGSLIQQEFQYEYHAETVLARLSPKQ